jgi:uncharacterized protein YkwD
MEASAKRHLHLRARGRAATAWCCTPILALAVALAGGASAAAHSQPRPSAKPRPERPCANANLQPTATNLARIDAATLCLIDGVRSSDRLRPLRFSSPLQSVAVGQARDMVEGDYFGDDSISGLTPLQRILATRYPARTKCLSTAQNIGWATEPLATPAGIVRAWMASPPHRQIILTPGFRDIGVGVATGAPTSLSRGLAGATYTIEFGLRVFSAGTARRPLSTPTPVRRRQASPAG